MPLRSPVVTGLGVLSAIGQGKEEFVRAMLAGESAFGVMRRPGRQSDSAYLGAEIGDLARPPDVTRQTWHAASLSSQTALVALGEAWTEARLSEVDPCRIGLVVGGSNVQQRAGMLTREAHGGSGTFVRPTYALSFMDSDLCGFCTAQFGIRGLAYTVGGASASGQVALVQAAQAVLTNQVDVCIAVGALMDLSHLELRSFSAIGAMGSDRFADKPSLACRPFDRERDGFIYGESCGAVVIESNQSSVRRGLSPYAGLSGWGFAVDGNRNPNPSLEGESRAIRNALECAKWEPAQVDYVNPHGTGSVVGDETELRALHACGLGGVRVNATKSLIGHGLTSAGTVEAIATLLQMRVGALHPTRNLTEPMDRGFTWILGEPVEHRVDKAMTLSMGFGGINTALLWERVG